MRILTITHGLPPIAHGGAELYAWHSAQALQAADGVDQVVILTRETDRNRKHLAIREEARAGLTLLWMNDTNPGSNSFADGYRNPALSKRIQPLLATINPDVAHVHHLTHLGTDLISTLRARNLPIVMTLHDYWLLCPRGQLLNDRWERCAGPGAVKCSSCIGGAATSWLSSRRLRRFARRLPAKWRLPFHGWAHLLPATDRGRAEIAARLLCVRNIMDQVDLFLVPSKTVIEQFASFGVPLQKLQFWPCGHPEFPQPEKHDTGASKTLEVGFFGTLMASKAPHLAIDAVGRLPAGTSRLHLYGEYAPYHGDNHYRAMLDLEAPHVVSHGWVSRNRAVAAMAELDAVVVPSIWTENAPLVISEAFLAGTPVVASRLGGMREIVKHECNGLLFEAGNTEDLAHQLRRLQQEPALAARLRAGTGPVRTIADDAKELAQLFSRFTTSRRRRTTPEQRPARVAVVIPFFGQNELTIRAANSCADVVLCPELLVLVDNGSTSLAKSRVRDAFPGASFIAHPEPIGFAAAVNLGIDKALRLNADQIILINSDVEIDGQSVLRLAEHLSSGTADIVAPLLVAGMHVEATGIEWHPWSGRFHLQNHGDNPDRVARGLFEVVAVPGTVMAIDRRVIAAVGRFDEGFFFGLEDLDFCLRARDLGFRVFCDTSLSANHLGAATLSRNEPARSGHLTRGHLLLLEKHVRRWRSIASAITIGATVADALLHRQDNRLAHLMAIARGILDIVAKGHRSLPDEVHP